MQERKKIKAVKAMLIYGIKEAFTLMMSSILFFFNEKFYKKSSCMTIFYTVLKRLIPFFQGEKIVETEQGSCSCCYSYLLWRQARSTHGIRGDSRAAACICGEGTAFVSGEACCLQTQCWRQPVLPAAPQSLL